MAAPNKIGLFLQAELEGIPLELVEVIPRNNVGMAGQDPRCRRIRRATDGNNRYL
jgi:hypothetical protein